MKALFLVMFLQHDTVQYPPRTDLPVCCPQVREQAE